MEIYFFRKFHFRLSWDFLVDSTFRLNGTREIGINPCEEWEFLGGIVIVRRWLR